MFPRHFNFFSKTMISVFYSRFRKMCPFSVSRKTFGSNYTVLPVSYTNALSQSTQTGINLHCALYDPTTCTIQKKNMC